jgi:hypothetical protein
VGLRMRTAHAQCCAFQGREAKHAGVGTTEVNANQDQEINKMKNPRTTKDSEQELTCWIGRGPISLAYPTSLA